MAPLAYGSALVTKIFRCVIKLSPVSQKCKFHALWHKSQSVKKSHCDLRPAYGAFTLKNRLLGHHNLGTLIANLSKSLDNTVIIPKLTKKHEENLLNILFLCRYTSIRALLCKFLPLFNVSNTSFLNLTVMIKH